ncbi:MAG: DUF4192 domain-containing protein [Actinomycetota bacterium]|nr:DUF4192 domain-containing protein [Actinomycetota bacterium]
MTVEPSLPPITCPSTLVASCAPLLGFAPRDCLVAFIHGVPGRRSPVILRVDLPAPDSAALAARHTATCISGTGGAAVDVVAWVGAESSATRRALPSTCFLAHLAEFLGQVGVEVGAMLSTNGQVWWSQACDDPTCCPEQATALDNERVTAVQAEYVFAGYAPLAGREELATRVARDHTRAATVERALHRRQVQLTPRWRATQIRFLTGLLLEVGSCTGTPSTTTPASTARALRALADIRVRDVVLRRLVVDDRTCAECWSATVEVLCGLLRGAPAGATAPVATVLALVAWMRGDGALATMSLQRAAEESGYRLAELAERLIASGTDPAIWRESLRELPESECLDPSGRGTPP